MSNNNNFKLTCDNEKLLEFSNGFMHEPQPISLSEEMVKTIEQLLWYVPNIDSLQSTTNEIIGNMVYDDFCFDYVIKNAGLDIDEDILWTTREDITNNYFPYFENSCCINCSKLILTSSGRDRTKTESLLRHFRNSIAHGNFTMVDNTFIGYDEMTEKIKNNRGIVIRTNIYKTAIIKMKPEKLLRSLESVKYSTGIFKEELFRFAFSRWNYEFVERIRNTSPRSSSISIPDFLLKKNGKEYIVEIKDYKHDGLFIYGEQVKRMIKNYKEEYNNPDAIGVLIIDNKKLTKEAKQELINDNIVILDINCIRGSDLQTDMLERAIQNK